MSAWIELSEFLSRGAKAMSESEPGRMDVGVGGEWWGVSTSPFGFEYDEKGNLTARTRPREDDYPAYRLFKSIHDKTSTVAPDLSADITFGGQP